MLPDTTAFITTMGKDLAFDAYVWRNLHWFLLWSILPCLIFLGLAWLNHRWIRRGIPLLFLLLSPVVAKADTLHVDISADAWMSEYDATSWSAGHDEDTCNSFVVQTDIRAGTWASGGAKWYFRRIPFIFNTSGLPDDCIIDAVRLYMYCYGFIDSVSPDEPTIHVVEGDFGGSLDAGDFEYGVDFGTTSGGSKNFSGLSIPAWYYIGFNSNGRGWISKTGNTELGLIEDYDLTDDSSGADGANRAIKIQGASGNQAYLKIWYHRLGVAPDSLRTDGLDNPGFIQDSMPEFTCLYRDSMANCDSIWWQVGAGGYYDMWNSGWIDVTNVADGNWIDTVDYAGSVLSRATKYRLRCRTKNVDGDSSDWSAAGDTFRIVSADTVYIIFHVDTESGNDGIRVDSLYPIIYFDTWHVAEGDTGYAWRALQRSFRDSVLDFGGNPLVMTWAVKIAEPYCSAYVYGYDNLLDACCSMYDTLIGVWGDTLESFGDEIAIHFHNYKYSLGEWRVDNTVFHEAQFERYLAEHLYYRKFFPSDYRAGWNLEKKAGGRVVAVAKGDWGQAISLFLEDRILFDVSNINTGVWSGAPGWRPYHPDTADFTNEGDMDRYVGRITSTGTLNINDINELYDSAAVIGKAEGSWFTHPSSHDMASHTITIHGLLDSVTGRTAIPFYWKTATEALAAYYGWTDTTDPTFNFVEVANDSMRVRTSEVIFQPYPYGVTVDYGADPDTLVRVEMNVTDDTTFKYSLLVYPYLVICAATDTCGNVGIDSTGQVRRGLLKIIENGQITKIIENGEIVKIFK